MESFCGGCVIAKKGGTFCPFRCHNDTYLSIILVNLVTHKFYSMFPSLSLQVSNSET